MAYGVLRLLPWEFGKLTPGEFHQALDGFEQGQKLRMRQMACLAAWLINGIGSPKRAIQISDLIKDGPKAEKRKQGNLREEHDKLVSEIKALMRKEP